jgi:hypothetical protein
VVITSENTDIESALLLLLLLRRRQKAAKQTRRWWVRPINRDREKKGEFRRLSLEMKFHVEWFFCYARMTLELFDNFETIVGPHLKKRSLRAPLSPAQGLAMTLR